MKVLAIAKTFSKGGAAAGARNTVAALESAGASVITLDGFAAATGKKRILRTAERVFERLAYATDVHCLRLGPATFNLEEVIREHRPNVVQLFDVSANTIAFDDLRCATVPVVQRLSDFWPYNGAHHYSEHIPDKGGFEEWLLERMIYSQQARPDLFVAPSQWLADRLPEGPVRVIRNAVSAQPLTVPRVSPHKPLRFGFISNPVNDPRKGLSALPRVLDAIAARIGPVEVHLYGNGSEQGIPACEDVSIHAYPAFRKNDLEKVYSSFDILLCPSLRDNSPNVVTEALSFGVPVVAQSGSGMDTYVDDRFGALVDFHAGPAEKAAREIADLVARYAAASAEALQCARIDLAPERIGAEYLAAYAELL